MKIDTIKEELFKLMNIERNSFYSSKSNQISCKEKYAIYKDYYQRILNDDSFSSVYNLKEKALAKAQEFEKKYNDLLDQYKGLTSSEDKNRLASIINPYVYKIEALNTIYNIINSKIRTEHNDNIEYSNNIIELITKYDKEKNIQEKEKILAEIYRLKDERRTVFLANYPDNVIEKICNLESIEFRIARSTDEVIEPTKLNKKKYIETLKETIKAINDYYFLSQKNSPYYKKDDSNKTNKFYLYLKRYHALITSLFKSNYYVIKLDNGKINTDDLLNYLSVYNIDNKYEVFAAKNSTNLIGMEPVNKTTYSQSVSLINKYINKLLEDCSSKIKGRLIEVVDTENDKDGLLSQRQEVFYDINRLSDTNKYGGRYGR